MINVLLLLPRPPGSHPLFQAQARLSPGEFSVEPCFAPEPSRGRGRLVGALRLVPELRRLLESRDIHIVNAHLHRMILPAVLAARLARNRPAVVATIHGEGSARKAGRRALNRLLYPRVERIVAVSDAVRQDILRTSRGLPPEKVVTIRNGIDYAAFPAPLSRAEARARLAAAANGGGLWFGTVGRLSRGKNTAALVRAFGRVRGERKDCTLVIAGAGPEEQALRSLAARLRIDDRVVFAGFRGDVPEVLAALDVFLHASLREGFGLAVLEAMAAGLPVVAARRGGVIELLGGADASRLVDPEDDGAIAGAMLDLAEAGPEARAAMGRRARERALRDFSVESMAAGIERLYHDIMERRRLGREPSA